MLRRLIASVVIGLVAVVVWVLGAWLMPYGEAYVAMVRGRRALEAKDYRLATTAFNEVLRLRPSHLAASEQLAIAYLRQYVPGGETPQNLELAAGARQQLSLVLEKDPSNEVALSLSASLAYDEQHFEDAQRVYERLAEVNPKTVDAHVGLGKLAWERFRPVYASARVAPGVALDAPGPIADASVRASLRAEWQSVLDAAMAHLARARTLDPNRADVLETMCAIGRARADLADTAAEYQRRSREADRLVGELRALRNAIAERRAVEAGQ
jgi:Tfp pilus assembly protein PilF